MALTATTGWGQARGVAPSETLETSDARSPYPDLSWLIFGSAGGRLDDRDSLGRDHSQDSLFGDLHVFALSDLSPRFAAMIQLGLNVEDPGDTTSRLEQLTVSYLRGDALQLQVGQLHTPLGFWNGNFNNVSFLRQTISRPEILRLEEDGGVLPIRSVGVRISGEGRFEKLRLGYSAGAFTSRRSSVLEQPRLDDAGSIEAINLQLSLAFNPTKRSSRTGQVSPLRDFELGFYGHFDSIPTEPQSVPSADVDERIVGGFVAWSPSSIEILGEYHAIRHRDPTSGRELDSSGWFLQWASRFGQWKLYQRVEGLELASEDPYYAPLDRRDLDRILTGVRWGGERRFVLSLELAHSQRQGSPDFRSLAAQLSFHLDPRQ